MPSQAKQSVKKTVAKHSAAKHAKKRRSCKPGKVHQGYKGRCVKACPSGKKRVVSQAKHRSRCKKSVSK